MEDFGFEEDGDQFDDDLVKAIQNSLKENFKIPAPNVMEGQTSKEPVNSSHPDTNIGVHDGQNKEPKVLKSLRKRPFCETKAPELPSRSSKSKPSGAFATGHRPTFGLSDGLGENVLLQSKKEEVQKQERYKVSSI